MKNQNLTTGVTKDRERILVNVMMTTNQCKLNMHCDSYNLYIVIFYVVNLFLHFLASMVQLVLSVLNNFINYSIKKKLFKEKEDLDVVPSMEKCWYYMHVQVKITEVKKVHIKR